nr:peptide deformylase [Paracoccus salsus]
MAGGVLRPILIHPDPVLRDVSQPSGYLKGPDLRQLAADLLASMYEAGGRGLAAPQIGVLRRIFVMDAGWKQGVSEPMVMLDPEIVVRSDRAQRDGERCLSIPGQRVEVVRPHQVTVAWYDLDGRRCRRALSGAAARIAQHEADHLEGRLIVDFL